MAQIDIYKAGSWHDFPANTDFGKEPEKRWSSCLKTRTS